MTVAQLKFRRQILKCSYVVDCDLRITKINEEYLCSAQLIYRYLHLTFTVLCIYMKYNKNTFRSMAWCESESPGAAHRGQPVLRLTNVATTCGVCVWVRRAWTIHMSTFWKTDTRSDGFVWEIDSGEVSVWISSYRVESLPKQIGVYLEEVEIFLGYGNFFWCSVFLERCQMIVNGLLNE